MCRKKKKKTDYNSDSNVSGSDTQVWHVWQNQTQRSSWHISPCILHTHQPQWWRDVWKKKKKNAPQEATYTLYHNPDNHKYQHSAHEFSGNIFATPEKQEQKQKQRQNAEAVAECRSSSSLEKDGLSPLLRTWLCANPSSFCRGPIGARGNNRNGPQWGA